VQLAFTESFDWLPRELPTSDHGIDMIVEEVLDQKPTGRLIAVQVKSGSSYFRERTQDGFVFRDATHVEYWTGYSLPVIVAFYDPTTKLSYWQSIDASTIVATGKKWKVMVPWSQRIDRDSQAALQALFGGDPYLNRLRLLRADLPLIRAAADGVGVVIDVEEWLNKTSGRGTVRVTVEEALGSHAEREWSFLAPGWDYAVLLPQLFPWASLELDVDTYEDHDRDQWDLETGAWDNEEGRYVVHSSEFEDWLRFHVPKGLRPYEEDGEIARWRLKAQLGPVGDAFLEVDRHLAGPD
jgi:hypothetical protein